MPTASVNSSFVFFDLLDQSVIHYIPPLLLIMPCFMTSAALAAIVSFAAGAPTELIEARSLPAGAFQIKQVSSGQQYINGQLENMKTYDKFASVGAVAPAAVVSAAQKAAKQQGSVTASPEQYDQAYLSPVTLGSSQVMLDFDTGSADLWSFSNEQPAAQRSGQYVPTTFLLTVSSTNVFHFQLYLQHRIRIQTARLHLEHQVRRRIGSKRQRLRRQSRRWRRHCYPSSC